MTDTYTVTADRWTGGWELHIAGIGVTQARKLAEAEVMARDLIHRRAGVPADSFDLKWEFKVGEEIDREAKEARAAVREAADAQKRAAVKSRAVAARLRASGLTGRDIATILGVTPQRVSQLLAKGERALRMAADRASSRQMRH